MTVTGRLRFLPRDRAARPSERGLVGAVDAAARIELRITPSIWAFRRRVAASTVEFSRLRLRNATPELGNAST